MRNTGKCLLTKWLLKVESSSVCAFLQMETTVWRKHLSKQSQNAGSWPWEEQEARLNKARGGCKGLPRVTAIGDAVLPLLPKDLKFESCHILLTKSSHLNRSGFRASTIWTTISLKTNVRYTNHCEVKGNSSKHFPHIKHWYNILRYTYPQFIYEETEV